MEDSIAADVAREAISSGPVPPLKILFCHRTQSRDGQFVHIQELIEALRAEGHSVVVVEPGHVGQLEFGAESKTSRTFKKYIPAGLYELMEFGYNLPEFLRLVRACRAHRPDLLYQRANIYMLSGRWLARLYGLPHLLKVNAPLTEERGRFGNLRLAGLAWWTERTAWRGADRVLPVTGVLARAIERAGVPPERITIVPNGVDLARFAPGAGVEQRRALALEGKLVLGFVGFVREWHHADAIVDLIAGNALPPDSHFLIVGDGPVKAALEDQARRLGVADKLTVTGIVPREKVADYIRCFDVALQPHVVAYASPLKMLEYMALARAIVAPATDNIRELLRHEESALLVAPDDRAAYAAAVARLAHNSALRARLGAAARATVLARELTWRHNARTVVDLARAARERR